MENICKKDILIHLHEDNIKKPSEGDWEEVILQKPEEKYEEEISDWEQFLSEESQNHSDDDFQREVSLRNYNLKKDDSFSCNAESGLEKSILEKFDLSMIESDTSSKIFNIKEKPLFNIKIKSKGDSRLWKVFNEVFSMLVSLFYGIYEAFLITCLLIRFLIYYVLTDIKDILISLKNYTNTASVFLIPIKIIPYLIYDGISSIRGRSSNEISLAGTNNNAISENCESKNNLSCTFFLLVFLFFGSFTGYCYIYPNSKVCCINLIEEMKQKANDIKKEIYVLPGEDCLKAGKCCKGFLEVIFRWSTCLLTLPIRATLTEWPNNIFRKGQVGTMDDMKENVNKIIYYLSEARIASSKRTSLIVKMKKKANSLQDLIKGKSCDIDIIEPVMKNLKKAMYQMKEKLNYAEKQISDIMSAHHNLDKMNEHIQILAKETIAYVKSCITKLQASIDVEQKLLMLKIEGLELLKKEDFNHYTGPINSLFQKVKGDLVQVKSSQDNVQIQLASLKNIPTKYRKMCNKLKTEIKNKLYDEFILHDQLSSSSECFCMKKIENLKKELEISENDFECFVNNLIDKQAKEMEKDIKTEISTTFYDRTVDIARKASEEVLTNQYKVSSGKNNNIKAAGFLSDVIMTNFNPEICDSIQVQSMNFSTFCSNKEELKNTLEEDDKCLSNNEIRKLIKKAVSRYSADKVGVADFALESMGGSVIASQSSSTYHGPLGLWSLFSNPHSKVTHSLRMIIQPNNQPGDCWPFKGSSGHAVVQLAHQIIVNAITLEHLPASLSLDGTISSAPKQFTIYNVLADSHGMDDLIGTFEYKENSSYIQTFLIQSPRLAKIIKMEVLTNHGNTEFTCIYRLRVHGELVETSESDK